MDLLLKVHFTKTMLNQTYIYTDNLCISLNTWHMKNIFNKIVNVMHPSTHACVLMAPHFYVYSEIFRLFWTSAANTFSQVSMELINIMVIY